MNFKMMNMMTIFSSSIWIICFGHLLFPTSISGINTAEGNNGIIIMTQVKFNIILSLEQLLPTTFKKY